MKPAILLSVILLASIAWWFTGIGDWPKAYAAGLFALFIEFTTYKHHHIEEP